jgi:large subunit ribosomal protein L24
MAMKIKKGDNVIVIAGKNKDREGKVLSVNVKENTVIVEGVNKVKKHTKPNQVTPNGGIVEMEAPINASNVMLSEGGKPVRVGFQVVDGKKVRVSKKTGKVI